jgi:hypothetical protein
VREKCHSLVAGEALTGDREHRLRDVEPDAGALGPVDAKQGQQAPIAGPEVEYAPRRGGHVVEEDSLALRPVRGVAGEVAEGVLGRCPLVRGHTRHTVARPAVARDLSRLPAAPV